MWQCKPSIWCGILSIYVLTQHLIAEEPTREVRGADTTRADNVVRLVLPPSIPAVVGLECNLYFDNVVLVARPGNVLFDTVCHKGRQQEERWTWTPTEADVGSHPLELVVFDEQNRRIAAAKCTIDVVSAKRGDGQAMSLLAIGDSLTHPSFYLRRLLDQCEKFGGPKLTLVGSHIPQATSPLLRHEGYGGWTAKRFATYFTEVKTTDHTRQSSPFLYRTGTEPPRLDFTAYCREFNEGCFPDGVTIFLGPNDMFSLDDARIDPGIDEILKYFDILVKMIDDVSPSTKIAVMLPLPPTASQDGFGANYGSGQTRWQFRRNQHRLVERMLEHYAGVSAKPVGQRRVDLIPTYLGFDTVHNYPTETVTANAATDVKIVRQSNGLHPATSGHYQIGDLLFAWLKSQTKE